MRIQSAAILFVLLVSVLSWLLKVYSQIANPHFAKFHTNFSDFYWELQDRRFSQPFFGFGGFFNYKKETFNPPSSAQRPQNMVQNHEKPSLSLFRAFGSGICSTPARYRTSRGLDKFGGGEQAGTIPSFKIQAVAVRGKTLQTCEGG